MLFPLKKKFYPSGTLDAWTETPNSIVLPIPPHVGSFGHRRKNHHHEGVDLYCDHGEPVFSMESGEIVYIGYFTGPLVDSPWWNTTSAILIKGTHYKLLYGEITPAPQWSVGQHVDEGDMLGTVSRVLRKDKGRPVSMLHLECYSLSEPNNVPYAGNTLNPAPDWLLDPTQLLLGSTLLI